MLTSLRVARNHIAFESNFATDIQALLRNVFPSFAADLTGFFNRFSPETPALALTSKQASFIREVTKHAYLDLAPLGAYVPEGLDTTYLTYIDILEQAVVHASQVVDKALSPFSMYLAQLINNPDTKLSSQTFDHEVKSMEKAREHFNAELGKCFKKGSTQTDVNIGKVVTRNNDWHDVFNRSEAMLKIMNKVDRSVMNKKVAECAKYLEVIQDKIKRGDFDGGSPQMAKNLGELSFNVASELEFYVAIYYKAAALTESINRTIKHFDDVFDKNKK
jgi:hypothetical protein